jgi:hypothetical protein
MSLSSATRNAESVLPEPVGASSSVEAPLAMDGQASACASVAHGNACSNQRWVDGCAKRSAWGGVATPRFYGVGVTLSRVLGRAARVQRYKLGCPRNETAR